MESDVDKGQGIGDKIILEPGGGKREARDLKEEFKNSIEGKICPKPTT